MTSRYVKPTFAILAALALSLAFAARTIAAPAAGLNWEVHGTGSGGVNLLTGGGGSSGPAMSQYIGNGVYSVTLNPQVLFSNNGAGGVCDVVTGSGSVTAANGDTISFATVGMLCNESDAFSPFHYNGTYRITAGSGRFAGVSGGGSLTVTFGSTNFIKIDGTITGL